MNADSGSEAKGAARRTSGQQVVDLPGVQRDHGDELLRQDVQRVGRHPQRLDRARAHPLGDHGRLHQVAAVLGEDHTGGDGAHLVSRPAHALEARRRPRAGTRPGRPGRRRPCRCPAPGWRWRPRRAAARPSGPPRPARAAPWRPSRGARGRAPAGRPGPRPSSPMSSAGEWCLGQRLAGGALVGDLVEPVAQPLRQAAGVGEHDGRAVRLDQVGDPLLDMRPDRGLVPPSSSPSAAGEPPSSPMSSTGHDHRQVELLARRAAGRSPPCRCGER